MARLLSVNVGLPRDIAWKGRTVHTAIWKNPVAGRCRVSRLNLEGDRQGDLVGHGGEQQAVFVYQIESYCLTMPFVSATVIESAVHCSRSLHRA
jgi:MOSC domain-containing protein YiiM